MPVCCSRKAWWKLQLFFLFFGEGENHLARCCFVLWEDGEHFCHISNDAYSELLAKEMSFLARLRPAVCYQDDFFNLHFAPFFFVVVLLPVHRSNYSAAYLLQPPDSHFLFFFQRIQFMLGQLVPVCLCFCFCNVCSLYFKIFTTLSHD